MLIITTFFQIAFSILAVVAVALLAIMPIKHFIRKDQQFLALAWPIGIFTLFASIFFTYDYVSRECHLDPGLCSTRQTLIDIKNDVNALKNIVEQSQ